MKSAVALVQAYRTAERSPVDVIDSILAKIESSAINAYITVLAEQARIEARAAQERIAAGQEVRALEGVPIAVKDLIDVAGYRTTMGAEAYANHISEQDADVVRLLRKEGAIIIGKANTHQFAYGSTGDRSFFGPVKNPHDPARITGGSSSGSAATVAAGLAYGSIGTDTSASIRLPAALCGVVGMQATLGLVSKEGVFPLSQTLDHIGPLSPCVQDNALLLEVIAQRPAGTYSGMIGQDINGLVIGVPTQFYGEYLSPSVKRSMQEAIEALQAAGATVRTVEIEHIHEIYDAQQFVLKVEAYATHVASLDAKAPYLPEVQARLLTGKDALASDYLQALKFQRTAQASFDKVLDDVDVLLTPTCGISATLRDERSTRINDETCGTMWLLTRLTAPTNFSGHPSLSVPFGKDTNGMPLGLQLIGKLHDEATLYQVARQLEISGSQDAIALADEPGPTAPSPRAFD